MFLRNGWYAAIWGDDLKDRPVGRIFLNDKGYYPGWLDGSRQT
jgi:hypothetical protein